MKSWFKRAHKAAPATPKHAAVAAAPAPMMLVLEPRIMFDAAVGATAVDVAHHAEPQPDPPPAPAPAAPEHSAPEPAAVDTPIVSAEAPQPIHNVVFVDSRVQEPASLLQNLAANTEVVYLQNNEAGLQQIADYLADHADASSIQIVAHGSVGDLWLGSSYLSSDNVAEHAAELSAIGSHMREGADILLYGCNTAADDKGLAFVGSLAELSGQDIAASDDRTGVSGDWDLEIKVGSIEAAPALALPSDGAYAHDLAILTVTTNLDSGVDGTFGASLAADTSDGSGLSLREAINWAANSGDTVTFNAGMTVTLATGQLTLGKSLTIDGDIDNNGSADVTIDANYGSRVLSVSAGQTVSLDGLVITKGRVSGNGGNGGYGATGSMGAGISNAGNLTLQNVSVTVNAASGGGGGGGVTGAYYGGGGGGGGGFGGIGGGHGGSAGPGTGTLGGQAGGGGAGGYGGGYDATHMGGRGGTTTGGAGGLGVSYYTNGGNGATATNGSLSIGGGGGGAGWDAVGGSGGNAAGGIYVATTGTLTVIGSSSITNNIAAGGGGGGGGGQGSNASNGGVGGRGVGAIWNKGTVLITAANFAAMSGNAGASGSGGAALGGGTTGSSPAAVNLIYNDGGTLNTSYVPNTTPVISNVNGNSVSWAGVGLSVSPDAGADASLTDTELGALNSGNGNWSGGSLSVQRSGTAISADTLGFNTSGALFTVSGSNLQSGGQTFATFTNTGGVLTINFTSSGTSATTALVNDVAQRINYRNDTPSGDATLRFTLSDGTSSTTADVTVASDTIYVTNTADTATINITNGVSFSEAVAIAAADASGSQILVINSALAGQTVSTSSAGALGENLTLDLDSASGVTLSGGTLSIGSGFSLTATNGSGDTATIATTLSGAGGLTKAGAGTVTLSGTNAYTGATTLSAGTLTVSGGDAISTSSSVAVASGTTLSLSASETISNLSGAGSVTLGGNTLSTRLTADSTFSGDISGSGGLSVNQTGAATFALTLSGTNTYTGSTTLQNYGWLRLDGDASLSSSSQLRFNGNSRATLLSDQTLGSVSSSAATASLDLGSFTLSAGGDNTSSSVAGVISGTGAVVKQGSGTLSLDGTNTYTGTTTVSAGTLSVSSGTALVDSNAVTVSSGATLDIAASETIGSLAGAGAVTLGANTLTAGGSNTSTTFSGGMSGTGGFTKTGSGTLSLSGTNTYTGATTLSAGAITITGGTSIDNGSAVTVASGATLTLAGGGETIGSLAGAGNVVLSYTLTSGADNSSTTFSGVISSNNTSGIAKTGSGTLTLSGSNIYTGSTTVSAGTLSVASDSNLGSGALTLNGGTLAVTGATTIDNAINLAASSTLNVGAAVTQTGAIGGTGNLTKTGAESLTLAGSNTYSGATTVSAGTLSVASDGNLGSGSLTLAGGTTLAVTGATHIDNAIALSGNATVSISADVTLSGVVSGGNNLAKSGASTLTLTGANTYTGTTTVSAGTLSIASDSNLGSGALTLAAGTTLAVTGVTTIDNAIALAGTATVDTSANATVSANITGAGGLTKAGASTLTLSGTGSHTGATSVNAGSLLVNGAVSASSGVTVASGATLGGSGSISSNTTVNSGGTLSPGNSPGTLTINGNLTMASGSTLAIEINGTTAGTHYDQVIVNGAVDVTGAALSVTHGYAPGTGDTYTIIVNDAADAVTGSFSGVSEGGSFIAGGNSTELTASYVAGTGNDVSLTTPVNPVVTSVSVLDANGTYNIGDTVTVAINFSEPVFLSTGTIELTLETGTTDRALSYISGSGSSTLYFNYTVQEGDSSLDLDYVSTTGLAANGDTIQGASFVDAILTLPTPGAAGSLGANANIVIDGVRPTAGIVVADTALAVGEASTVTITFNEAVSGLTTADFAVANGALSGLSSSDGGITWTATLTPTASVTDTTNLVTLDNTGLQDLAGNAGSGTTDSNNYAIDTLRPTAGIVVADTALAVGETSTVTITFNEAVSGLTTADFTVANGALSGLSSSDGGITWTATLTPSTTVDDTTNLVSVDNTGLTDLAGNAGSGTTDSNNYAIDSLRPTASTVVADTALAVGESSTVTIIFSEAVSGLTTADFTVANGVLSDLSSSDGVTWTATLTPTASVEDSTNLVTLDNTGLQDSAGNAGLGTTDSNNYAIDTLRPSASIVVADTALAVGETSTITITFNEAVSGLTTADFSVANAVLSGLSSSDGGITWTATLTPTAGVTDSTNLITLDNTGVQDLGGNAGTGTTDSNNYALDTLRPSASIVMTDSALASGDTSLVTITFNEAVAGFSNADLTVANGTLSAVNSSDGGITWTATFTPTANLTDATNLITLANTGVQDTAGNAGTGSTDSGNYAIDTASPSVTSVSVPADATYLAGENLDFSVNLSEAVMVDTSGGTPRIAITLDTGGTVYANYLSGSGSSSLVFRAIVSTGQIDSNGITVATSLDLNGGTLHDTAGNDTAIALNGVASTAGVQVDAVAPTVAAVSLPADGHYNVGDVLSFTINTSEAVTVAGAPQLALDMGGNTVYATYVSGSGSSALLFQYTVQPGDNDADGLAPSGVQNNGGTLRDAPGNDMVPELNGVGATAGVVVDTTDPAATGIVRVDSTPTAADSVGYTVTFSEAVSGLDLADFALSTTGTASGSITSVTQLDAHTYSVLLTDLQGVGELGLDLNSAGVTDVAGNTLASELNGERYELRPIVVVAPPAMPPNPEPPPPPPPPIVTAPSTPPVTLVPTDPITPITAPTLGFSSPMGIVAVSVGPSATDAFAAPTISAVPSASARSFVEVGAASGAGLQSTPEIGNFSTQPGQPVSISLPSATFTHSERNAQVSVEVRLANGRPLPAWLKFDPVTGTLSGQPPPGLNQKLSIEIVARDSKGNRANSHLNIEVKSAVPPTEAAPPKPRPEPGALLIDPMPFEADLAAALAHIQAPEPGRASLAAQFERFGTAARQAERAALLEHARAAALNES